MKNREGLYPAPPFWPERLTVNNPPPAWELIIVFVEYEAVEHTYLADGWPGPCWTRWIDGNFADWFPALTIERAERGAAV